MLNLANPSPIRTHPCRNSRDPVQVREVKIGKNMKSFVLAVLSICVWGLMALIPSNGQAQFIPYQAFLCGTSPVSDIQNNIYPTTVIGKQCWITQNLRVTKYRNGDLIGASSVVRDPPSDPRIGHYYPYNKDLSNAPAYGFLYNRPAIDDARGLCPNGWRVPSEEDWLASMTALGVVDGGELPQLPIEFPQTLAGMMSKDGSFYGLGQLGFWWSSSTAWSSKAGSGDVSERNPSPVGYQVQSRKSGYVVSRELVAHGIWGPYASLSVRCVVGLSSNVTTSPVVNVTSTSAATGGSVTNPWGVVSKMGIVYGTASDPKIETDTVLTGQAAVGVDTFGVDTFEVNLTGLIGNSEYFVRAFAVSSVGIDYGPAVSFKTSPVLPAVDTNSVSLPPSYGGWGAISGGRVTSDGGSTVTARGVAYGTSENPTIAGLHTLNDSGAGGFVSTLVGLTPSTTYYARAYATNAVGTGYGSQITFETSSLAPEFKAISFANGTVTSVTLNVSVNVPGQMYVTEVGFVYGQSENPTIAGDKKNILPTLVSHGNVPSDFSGTLRELDPCLLYRVRAYATNGSSVAYGKEVSWTAPINSLLTIGGEKFSTSVSPSSSGPSKTIAKVQAGVRTTFDNDQKYVQGIANLRGGIQFAPASSGLWDARGTPEPVFVQNFPSNTSVHTLDVSVVTPLEMNAFRPVVEFRPCGETGVPYPSPIRFYGKAYP
jgi:uncharacterized protein (TIGR02145 family)